MKCTQFLLYGAIFFAGARWTQGTSIDGKGEFTFVHGTPLGTEPKLSPPIPEGYAQMEQKKPKEGGSSSIADSLL